MHLLWQQYARTLVLGAPPPVERQGLSRGWGSGDTAGWYPLAVYRGAMSTSGPGSVLIWSNPSGETAAADAICPRSLWNCFSGTTFLPLKELRQFSTAWACSYVRRAVILHTTHWLHTEKRDSLHRGELAIFPVDPKPQLAEVPKHQVPVIAQLLSGLG